MAGDTETNIAILALKEREKIANDAAKALDQQAADAKNSVVTFERDAAANRARAAQFRSAITKLGA